MRLRTGCPWINRSSSRAKVRARAHAAISMQSRWLRPVKSAEAHINTRCSARLELTGDKLPGADALLGPPKRSVAILAFTSTTQSNNQKNCQFGKLKL